MTESWWDLWYLMRRLRLDEDTETWWEDWGLMRRLRLDETTETWWDDWDLLRRHRLDETTETGRDDLDLMRRLRLDEMAETWWNDWDLMRRLRLDETTDTWWDDWWDDWDLMRRLRLDETTGTWWEDWDLISPNRKSLDRQWSKSQLYVDRRNVDPVVSGTSGGAQGRSSWKGAPKAQRSKKKDRWSVFFFSGSLLRSRCFIRSGLTSKAIRG